MRRFVFTWLILIALPLAALFSAQGGFAVAMLSAPLVLWCVWGLVGNLFRLWRPSLSRREHGQRALLCCGAILFVAWASAWADHDLAELANQRRQLLSDIRPSFQRYLADHGHWPTKPDDLVPTYLPAWPDNLRNDGQLPREKRVLYQRLEGQAPVFIYFVARGPDSAEMYDIGSGQFSRNR